jgi:hypothetical protein
LDSFGSGQDPVVGSLELCNNISYSRHGEGCTDQRSNHPLKQPNTDPRFLEEISLYNSTTFQSPQSEDQSIIAMYYSFPFLGLLSPRRQTTTPFLVTVRSVSGGINIISGSRTGGFSNTDLRVKPLPQVTSAPI